MTTDVVNLRESAVSILFPISVIPIRTADAFADAHHERVVTNLFPSNLDNRSSLSEEIHVEEVKRLGIERSQTHSAGGLAGDLVHNDGTGLSTILGLKSTRIVGRSRTRTHAVDVVLQGNQGVVSSFLLVAEAEVVRHLTTQPCDLLALALNVEFRIERVNAEIRVCGQVLIYQLTITVQQPVNGDLGFRIETARAEMQLVQVRLTLYSRIQDIVQNQCAIAAGRICNACQGLGLKIFNPKTTTTVVALRLRAEAQEPQQNA